jgi:hypothetical protein
MEQLINHIDYQFYGVFKSSMRFSWLAHFIQDLAIGIRDNSCQFGSTNINSNQTQAQSLSHEI